MICDIITIHEENKPDIKGFIISDYEKDYFLIIDENHNIRDIDNTDYTYDNIKSLKIPRL